MYKDINDTRIVNLEIIAMLEDGDKLYTTDELFVVEKPGLRSWQAVKRFVFGESRTITVSNIKSLVKSCIEQKNLCKEDIELLCKQLIATSAGIRNLSRTYASDKTARASIKTLLDTIEHFVNIHMPIDVREDDASSRGDNNNNVMLED